ncbi:acetyltransferase [Pontibacter lucknowensis]|uniref:Acetyltransferase EpsM n=1 Tax=Pontibacter lucknowensis TaxID=1077936 RepID=A0A1N7AT41_9BACT|nr:acetyltransferase [Pontibacter lucknowensis]SIR42201.1 acetyltransferase EpsM [Pontibacter lucknowensis]
MPEVGLIGYSGHAYVVADSARAIGLQLLGYFESSPKNLNPFELAYLGDENNTDDIALLRAEERHFFIAIGANRLRAALMDKLLAKGLRTLAIIHPSAIVSPLATVGVGTLVAPGCKVNALARIGRGVIINTGAVIEHECQIDDFAHIAPGAVLAGNVSVGSGSFVGANAVIKEGVRIGRHVTVGAGAVILHDIGDNEKWVGNPGKLVK